MVNLLGDIGILTNPGAGYYEIESTDFKRSDEIVVELDYTKGDENYIAIEPVVKNPRLGGSGYRAMGVTHASVPVKFIPYIIQLTGGEDMQISLPKSWYSKYIKFKITFVGLGGGAEGTLNIGIYPNKMEY